VSALVFEVAQNLIAVTAAGVALLLACWLFAEGVGSVLTPLLVKRIKGRAAAIAALLRGA
jgi:hypothetical protein